MKKFTNKEFRKKYGLFDSIEECYQFISDNPKEQLGKDSIQWIAPYMSVLYEYGCKSDIIVEFGINQVNSTFAFLHSKPKHLISVDIDLHRRPTKNVPEFEGINYWLMWAKELALKSKIEFTIINGNSINVEIPECDLLFIDSLHTETHLRNEITKHISKIKKYLILHDTALFSHQLMPAVTELVDNNIFEIVEQFTDNPGLTI